MTPAEAAALLTIAAGYDNRKPDADTARLWSLALNDLRLEDCRDAVIAHYTECTDWLMPPHIVTRVKRIRAKRVADHGPVEPPPGLDPDDTLAWRRWQRETTRAIADGNPPPRHQVQAVPMPRELASGMARFGQMPTDETEGDGA